MSSTVTPPEVPRARRIDGSTGVLERHGYFLDVPRGRWDTRDVHGAALLFVVTGALLIERGAGATSSAEVLGPGDVATVDVHGVAGPEAGARVIEPARLYVLVDPLAELLADWPRGEVRLIAALLERHRRRDRHQAILGYSKVEHRALLTLWALAERFGVQTPDGAVLSLRLTHQMLGCLIAARRPTVTSALGVLRTARLIAWTGEEELWISAAAAGLERTGRLP